MTGVVEGYVVGALIGGLTNLLTDGINPLLQNARAARRCEQECRKLADSVESIKRNVQHILGQFKELEHYDANAKHDLQVVHSSVEKLRRELELADIDVHECDSASKLGKKLGGLGGHSRLSKKITARNESIAGLGKELVQANFSLTSMLNNARARRSSFEGQQQSLQHRPSIDLQQWYRDVDDIQQRANSTRHSQRLQSEYSLHTSASYGSTSSGSSTLYADDSNHHSSHYTDHVLHRSNATAPTHHHVAHDLPEKIHHVTSTVPRSNHVTHSEGAQVRLQDPFVPHLEMYMN